MNRNFKTVLQRSIDCFSAVAEYAKSQDNLSGINVTSSTSTANIELVASTKVLRLSVICIGLAAAGFSMQATAGCPNGANGGASARVECGAGANASSNESVALGRNSLASGSQSIAIGGVGNNTTAQVTESSGDQSIAIGSNTVSSGSSSIAIGGDDLNRASSANVNSDGNVTSFGVGNNSGNVNTSFKKYSGRDLVGNPVYPNTRAKGEASVAIGVQAESNGALSTAFGTQTKASAIASAAFGVSANASKEGSVAIGAGAATDDNATAEEDITINGTNYSFAGNVRDTDGTVKTGAQVSVGSKSFERQIKNVAGGKITADSTDAVNGSQLAATNSALGDLGVLTTSNTINIATNASNIATNASNIATNAFNITTNTSNIATNATNINRNTNAIGDLSSGRTGMVQQNSTGTGTGTGTGNITVGAATGGTEVSFAGTQGDRVLTNVADGMAPRDAVNFGQLNGMERRLGNSINELGYRIDDVEDDANAGISAAMAMSSLPQSNMASRSMIGGGIATYNGESAVAVGISRVSDNGRWAMKINGTADTQGNAGGAIGAGFHF